MLTKSKTLLQPIHFTPKTQVHFCFLQGQISPIIILITCTAEIIQRWLFQDFLKKIYRLEKKNTTKCKAKTALIISQTAM